MKQFRGGAFQTEETLRNNEFEQGKNKKNHLVSFCPSQASIQMVCSRLIGLAGLERLKDRFIIGMKVFHPSKKGSGSAIFCHISKTSCSGDIQILDFLFFLL